MTIGAAYLALAYFGFDDFDGIALVYHVGDVFAFVFEVVELEYAVVGCTAVGAFTVDAFESVYECFVACSLVFVLDYACGWVFLVPFSGALGRTAFAGGLESV